MDEDDVAERVLTTHFIRDLMGNLSAFSKQKSAVRQVQPQLPANAACRQVHALRGEYHSDGA